jgi:hypothetical protein
MSGLLRRLRRTSTPAPDSGDAPTQALPEVSAPAAEPLFARPVEDRPLPDGITPTPAISQPVEGHPLPGAVVPAPAAEAPAGRPVEERPLPAGVAPEELVGQRPDTRRRSRLRRRLRHLRRVRELMLRDLGGLVYEVHREHATDDAAREHQAGLIQGKVEHLAALDAERHDLEAVLGDRRTETVLREPGIGGACASCGEYLPSDARFCARCGTPATDVPSLAADAPAPAAEPAAEAPTPAVPAVEPAVADTGTPPVVAAADEKRDVEGAIADTKVESEAETAEQPAEVRT